MAKGSVFIKKEVLPFETTWTNIENVMLRR